jgi:hypothetical protein
VFQPETAGKTAIRKSESKTNQKGVVAMERKYVKKIILDSEPPKKVADAEIQLGNVTISQIHIWRSGYGRLRVHFPHSVDVPADVRSEIATEVIAAYRDSIRAQES